VKSLACMLAVAALGLAGCNTVHLNPTAVDFGDSVSKAYASDARLDLYGQVDFRHDPWDQGDIPPSNSSAYTAAEIAYANNNGYSSTMLVGMETRLTGKTWYNVLAFNSGYHDMQRPPSRPVGTTMISQSVYRNNLEAIAQLVEQHAGVIIWVDTPDLAAVQSSVGPDVVDEVNVPIYNGIAHDVAHEHGFYILNMPSTGHDGTVHFTPAGYRILGQRLADCVLTALNGAQTDTCHK